MFYKLSPWMVHMIDIGCVCLHLSGWKKAYFRPERWKFSPFRVKSVWKLKWWKMVGDGDRWKFSLFHLSALKSICLLKGRKLALKGERWQIFTFHPEKLILTKVSIRLTNRSSHLFDEKKINSLTRFVPPVSTSTPMVPRWAERGCAPRPRRSLSPPPLRLPPPLIEAPPRRCRPVELREPVPTPPGQLLGLSKDDHPGICPDTSAAAPLSRGTPPLRHISLIFSPFWTFFHRYKKEH